MSGLAASVADQAGRARRRQAAASFATWWNGEGGVGPLRAALDTLPADPGAEAVLAATQPWLDDLGWIERAIGHAIAGLRADPLFEPPLRIVSHETQNGLRLLTHRLVAVTLFQVPADRLGQRKRADLGARSIAFTGNASRLRVIRAGGAALDLWTHDATLPCLSGADAGRCRPAGHRVLRNGETIGFDGARTSWTFAGARGDIVLLQAVARVGVAPLTLEYDPDDGGFVAATMTDAAAARMQLIAGLLRQMGRADAAPVIAGLVREAPFHLRWALMRELLALDAALALPLLGELAARDPHDEIRAAARLTLDRIAA